MADTGNPNPNSPANPPANPPANSPTNPPTPPANAPPNPPANPNPNPQPQPQPNPPQQTLTLDQVDEVVGRRLGEARRAWETETLDRFRKEFRENYEVPARRKSKIDAGRERLKAAHKYLPADDDATDPTSPGDLAALADLDDVAEVAKGKDGKALTRLDVELNRTLARLMGRKPQKTGDTVPDPQRDADVGNEFDKIRKDVAARAAADAERAKRPLPAMIGG